MPRRRARALLVLRPGGCAPGLHFPDHLFFLGPRLLPQWRQRGPSTPADLRGLWLKCNARNKEPQRARREAARGRLPRHGAGATGWRTPARDGHRPGQDLCKIHRCSRRKGGTLTPGLSCQEASPHAQAARPRTHGTNPCSPGSPPGSGKGHQNPPTILLTMPRRGFDQPLFWVRSASTREHTRTAHGHRRPGAPTRPEHQGLSPSSTRKTHRNFKDVKTRCGARNILASRHLHRPDEGRSPQRRVAKPAAGRPRSHHPGVAHTAGRPGTVSTHTWRGAPAGARPREDRPGAEPGRPGCGTGPTRPRGSRRRPSGGLHTPAPPLHPSGEAPPRPRAPQMHGGTISTSTGLRTQGTNRSRACRAAIRGPGSQETRASVGSSQGPPREVHPLPQPAPRV